MNANSQLLVNGIPGHGFSLSQSNSSITLLNMPFKVSDDLVEAKFTLCDLILPLPQQKVTITGSLFNQLFQFGFISQKLTSLFSPNPIRLNTLAPK